MTQKSSFDLTCNNAQNLPEQNQLSNWEVLITPKSKTCELLFPHDFRTARSQQMENSAGLFAMEEGYFQKTCNFKKWYAPMHIGIDATNESKKPKQ